MKRFRPLSFDFDFTANGLTLDIPDHWEPSVKEAHRRNRESIERWIRSAFGELNAEEKLRNYAEMGPKPLSVLAFHNKFFEQIRKSFVGCAYYPALTGACALGERILNHLVLALRDDFKATPDYKRVYRKDSFDNWDLAIDTLAAWDVLLPAVVGEFRKLRDRRNDAIHFRPDVDHNDRALALQAIQCLAAIIGQQFSAFGPQPWFITGVPGEVYIKKEWEERPFIRRVYLPGCLALGPYHVVKSVGPWVIDDEYPYKNGEISDDEFCSLRIAGRPASP